MIVSLAFKNEDDVLFAGCDNGDIFHGTTENNKIEKAMVNPEGYHIILTFLIG